MKYVARCESNCCCRHCCEDGGQIYLRQILYDETVVKSVHLSENKSGSWRLHTGTSVAFLIKTADICITTEKLIILGNSHVHAFYNFHVNLDFFAELQQLREKDVENESSVKCKVQLFTCLNFCFTLYLSLSSVGSTFIITEYSSSAPLTSPVISASLIMTSLSVSSLGWLELWPLVVPLLLTACDPLLFSVPTTVSCFSWVSLNSLISSSLVFSQVYNRPGFISTNVRSARTLKIFSNQSLMTSFSDFILSTSTLDVAIW